MKRYSTVFRLSFLLFATMFLPQCADYQVHEAPPEELTAEVAPSGKMEYSTFMVGDLGYDYERGLTTLEAMIEAMPPGKRKSSLLLLGDITGPDGLRKRDGAERDHLDAIATRLRQVPGKVFYTPGENELGRESKFGRLDRLEEYFEDHVEKKVRFMPNNVCSGPDDEQLFDGVGLIGINTAWYMADWTRDEEVSEGCDYRNRDAMTFALADEIKGYRDQVKIVMMHHPMQAMGNRGGQFSLAQHLLPIPVLGSIIRGVQSVSGGPNDVSNLLYQQMIGKIKFGIDDEINVIFVSGNEHNMTLFHEGEYMQVIAGSGSKRGPAKGGRDANFNYGAIGYSRLDFYDSGEVFVGFYTVDEQGEERRVFYRRIIEDRHESQDEGIEEVPTEMVTDKIVRTSVYGDVGDGEKSAFGKSTLGRHYRPLYYLPIEVPVMMLDTFAGGLTPYRRGGGQTTMSLHTAGADGHLYQMRSVRKNPAQLLPSLLEQSFAADITKDVFTSIHPYAPLALPPWQKKLGLLGADPLLRYVPKQSGLASFNTNFGGEMYWLEQRPDEDWSGTRFFGGSKDIISNTDMREQITSSWKHYADDKNYARARLFDFWIGDWDRHRDQWRWAAFKEDDGRTRYLPVARDRDQVFSNYDGGILGLARVFVAEARKLRPFTSDLTKAKWRAMNGKWNDRVFLNQLTREEMLAEARYIQQTITDEDIDAALDLLPKEVKEYSLEREDIDGKLKQRLTQLETFAEAYYEDLAEKVNVLGTEKDDVIRATGLANGDLHLQLFDADKNGKADELFFDRVFHQQETKEVVVYGLDGDDRFELLGEKSGVKLRLIGGTDGDVVKAEGDLKALAYDEKKGMKLKGKESKIRDRRTDNYPELNQFNFEEYHPDYSSPIPAFGFNVDDGFLIGAGFTRVNHGFRPDPYGTKHTFLATYSTNEFFKVAYDGEFNHAFGRRKDLIFNTHYFSDGYVANFFGIGNEGFGQPEEGEVAGLSDDNILEFNRARRREVFINPMLRFRGKRNRLSFSVGPFFHSYDLDDDTPDYALILNTAGIPDRVFDDQPFAGVRAQLQSNNVAVPLLADSGIKYELYGQQSFNLNEDRATLKYGGQFTIYRMLTKAINVASRISFEHNDGSPEYYQLASMGGRTNYRAARADRYRGNTMFAQNIDLRFMGFGFGKGEAPTVGGFIIGMDYGRVWLDGEDSDTWHVGYGGGVWLAPLGATIITLTYFQDDERGQFAFAAGWPF